MPQQTPRTEWYQRTLLLGLMLIVLPAIALVGLYYNTRLARQQKVMLAAVATVNLLGQLSIVILFLLSPD